MLRFSFLSTAVVALLAGSGAAPVVAQSPQPMGVDTVPTRSFAITSVRLFDGDDVSERVNVVVRDGRIEAVGPDIAIPDGLPVLSGEGRTLLPGLVDAHTHTFAPDFLEAALAFGVTLHLDMFSFPGAFRPLVEEQANGSVTHRAHILSAGILATAPGGHGTQFGPVPPVESADHADSWVADRAAEGASFIKIILEDGRTHGLSMPTLDEATIRALVQAAHARKLKTVIHVSSLDDAKLAHRAGGDGYAHIWVDRAPDTDFLNALGATGTFVIPTLAVLERIAGQSGGPALTEHPDLGPLLDAFARQTLGTVPKPSPNASWTAILESIRLLHEAGVPILAGTDAPNPGTAFGASIHRELELFVEAGLSPVEALRTATSAPADAFGLTGVGRIRPGAPADLLLVDGDPTTEITDTRRIHAVWKNGVPFDHAAWKTRATAAD